MWTDLLEPRLHQAAYALDSTMIELIFISGPLLTAVIAAVTSPAGALIVSAVAVVTGTAIFTALPPTAHVDSSDVREHHGLLGALTSPGVRILVLTSFPTGIGLGMLEVGIPAFSRAMGAAELAGVLLAIVVVRLAHRRPRLRHAPAPLAVADAPGHRRPAPARAAATRARARTSGRWRCS